MSDFSLNLKSKIDPVHARAFQAVAHAAMRAQVDWLLVGAMARDWLLEMMYGIETRRQTKDADIAIAIPDWPTFEALKQQIVASGEFLPNSRVVHRLDHASLMGFHLDLVPFGAVADEYASIAWPPKHEIVMNVIGYADALAAAIAIRVSDDLEIKVASLPGLALLKYFAWQDRHRESSKDAWDLRLLLRSYETAGNGERIHDEGVLEAEDFDAERASCRLLGRDVARIALAPTLKRLIALLDRELQTLPPRGLIEEIAYVRPDGISQVGSEADAAAVFEKATGWVASFRAGLQDVSALPGPNQDP
jgi:predicted nucleotidyltransferase